MVTKSAQFDKLSRLISNASSKFLHDIETWRKKFLPKLTKLVNEAESMSEEHWWKEVEEWAKLTLLWPPGGDPRPVKLVMGPMHWQFRCYLWMEKLKAEFITLATERHGLLKDKLSLLQQLTLLFPKEIERKLGIVHSLIDKILAQKIESPLDHERVLMAREQIERLFGELEEEVEEIHQKVVPQSDDPIKQKALDDLFALNHTLDDNTVSLKLIMTYFDWANNEKYIHEVVVYLEKLEYLMNERAAR